jgi:hypothetical protein
VQVTLFHLQSGRKGVAQHPPRALLLASRAHSPGWVRRRLRVWDFAVPECVAEAAAAVARAAGSHGAPRDPRGTGVSRRNPVQQEPLKFNRSLQFNSGFQYKEGGCGNLRNHQINQSLLGATLLLTRPTPRVSTCQQQNSCTSGVYAQFLYVPIRYRF